jgi:hypothetical protein
MLTRKSFVGFVPSKQGCSRALQAHHHSQHDLPQPYLRRTYVHVQ